MADAYLIQNGQVHDGRGDVREADVRIADGVIAQVAPGLSPDGDEVIDARGLIVAPGLIDLHVHCFDGLGIFSVAPADIGLKTGVTTMVDTGSAGYLNYGAFHKYVMPAAAEDVFAFLHISGIGCHGNPSQAPYFGELADLRHVDVDRAVACAEQFADRIIGMKVRLTAGLAEHKPSHENFAMRAAIDAAERIGKPCMFHHALSNIAIDRLLTAMRPGDIYTHTYHSRGNTPFDDNGRPLDIAVEARQRGMHFDIGHGVGSFAWRIAERACGEHDFWPDSISTDLHKFCINGPVYDMTTTMSKMLHLGMPLDKLIRACSFAPARAIGIDDRFGVLAAGRSADVTVLRIEHGDFDLTDVNGETRTSERRLAVVETFKSGRRYV